MKKLTIAFILALFLTVPFVGTASAEYPVKPIQLTCAWTTGGAADLALRILANAVKNDFSEPVVIVNRPGAGGIVATTMVSRAKPDGYTLIGIRVANGAIVPALNKTIQYKWDDFIYLGLLDINPLVFVVRKDSPFKNLNDLADAIKAKPGSISFCNTGALNIQELTAYAFLRTLGLTKSAVVSVPFPSDAAGKNAILGGHVQVGALNFPAVFDQLGEGGQLRALAVTTPDRLADYPNIPTVREAGYPELENLVSWNALCGVKGMPQEAIDKWVAALAPLMENKDWLEPTKNMGSIPYILSPEKTKEFVAAQVAKFEELGKALDLFIQ